MLSVVIKDDGEPKVVQLTYENLYRELKDIPGAELIVSDDWFKSLKQIKNQYVCFVEADCLVSSGYFTSQMGLIKKNTYLRKLAVFGCATGVNSFGNRFFGYEIAEMWSDRVNDISIKSRIIQPVKAKKSNAPYPVQIVYVPGAILRMSMLMPFLDKIEFGNPFDDLTQFSAQMCLKFWGGEGRVSINPNATYVTTEEYVNDLNTTESSEKKLLKMFKRELI